MTLALFGAFIAFLRAGCCSCAAPRGSAQDFRDLRTQIRTHFSIGSPSPPFMSASEPPPVSNIQLSSSLCWHLHHIELLSSAKNIQHRNVCFLPRLLCYRPGFISIFSSVLVFIRLSDSAPVSGSGLFTVWPGSALTQVFTEPTVTRRYVTLTQSHVVPAALTLTLIWM